MIEDGNYANMYNSTEDILPTGDPAIRCYAIDTTTIRLWRDTFRHFLLHTVVNNISKF